jgi:hypothetical protein
VTIEIDGHLYEILIGTDVARAEAANGAFLEMHALDTPGTNPVLFAFRSNESDKVDISLFRPHVDLTVLKFFLRVVEEEFARWPLLKDPS